MALRISQRQIYSNMVGGMNGSLNSLMNLFEQDASQKKVNRPSDDPYAMAQIMASNSALSSIGQYRDNLSMAQGWLGQADSTLGLVHDELTSLQTLLQQGATTELTPDQRRSLATKARETLDQLIAYTNTPFGGRSIFAGHKTDGNAYERVLAAHIKDPNLADTKFKISGDNDASAVIQFTQSGNLDDVPPPTFRYSLDGGESWMNGVWDGNIMRAGSVSLEPAIDPLGTGKTVTAVDPDNIHENNNGTWIFVSPSAQYMGDTNDATVTQVYPAGGAPNVARVQGTFNHDVAVRVDDVSGTGRITYSYSLDNGGTWVTGNSSDTLDLHVPGGVLTLQNLPAGVAPPPPADPADLRYDQFIVRPYKADIELTIGNHASIVVNNVGKDVFGGLYEEPFSVNGAQTVEGVNMFDLVSRAIAAFESNSQQDCQAVLGDIGATMEHVVNYRTMSGARMNRVESIAEQLDYLEYDEDDRLSALEDADLSELLNKISAQQLAYNSILKTSGMIMQMSLMNFI